jgi:hypothetical protein
MARPRLVVVRAVRRGRLVQPLVLEVQARVDQVVLVARLLPELSG